jgi:hypothetical protein
LFPSHRCCFHGGLRHQGQKDRTSTQAKAENKARKALEKEEEEARKKERIEERLRKRQEA